MTENNTYKISELKLKTSLENIQYTNMLVKEMQQRRDDMFEMLAVAGVTYDKARASNRNYSDSQVERLVIEAEKLDEQIVKETARLINQQRKINSLINRIPEYRHRLVLIKKYIDNKSFEQIASEMNYSVRHTQRIADQALCTMIQALQETENAKTDKSAKDT
ncbi:MAG: DUF1492 domain-containing protein [Anaerofustis stercorihominis]|nr:DUF1492 domain-containing protein [Anaerofustis stercorihominis]